MSDLDIVIALDPAPAAASARKVTEEVKKTEAAAKSAEAAYESFGTQLARVARYQQLEAEAAKKATQARGEQAAAAMASVRGFAGVAEAIGRETRMLEKIHGPMRQHQQDVQVLNKLFREGKIDAEQYAAALSKSSAGASGGGGGGNLASIASGVGAINFKQAAQGVGQAFELVNQKLKITDTALGSALGSAVKFGAAGAQIGGPWGAALGAVVGIGSDLIGTLWESEAATAKLRKEAEAQATAYWDGVKAAERKKRAEEELAPQLEKVAKWEREIADLAAARQRVTNSASDSLRHATNRAMAYGDALGKVNTELALKLRLEAPGSDPLAGGGQTDDESSSVRNARGLRDAQNEAYAATKSYGSALADLARTENTRNDRLRDLEQIMGDIEVSSDVRTRAFREYNGTLKQMREEATGAAKAVDGLRLVHLQTWEQLHSNKSVEVDAVSGVDAGPPALTTSAGWRDVSEFGKLDVESDSQRLKRGFDEARASLTGIGEEAKKVGEAYKTAVDGMTRLDSLLADQLIGNAREFSSLLIDAASGADASWSNFFAGVATGLQKAIAQALILKAITGDFGGVKGPGGYGGLFGLLGGATGLDAMVGTSGQVIPRFATGGDAMVAGAGGTDSRIAMLRVTPGESIHVRTPDQQRASAAPSGGTSVTNNVTFDPRALLAVNGTKEGRQSIVNAIVLDAPTIRKALGIR